MLLFRCFSSKQVTPNNNGDKDKQLHEVKKKKKRTIRLKLFKKQSPKKRKLKDISEGNAGSNTGRVDVNGSKLTYRDNIKDDSPSSSYSESNGGPTMAADRQKKNGSSANAVGCNNHNTTTAKEGQTTAIARGLKSPEMVNPTAFLFGNSFGYALASIVGRYDTSADGRQLVASTQPGSPVYGPFSFYTPMAGLITYVSAAFRHQDRSKRHVHFCDEESSSTAPPNPQNISSSSRDNAHENVGVESDRLNIKNTCARSKDGNKPCDSIASKASFLSQVIFHFKGLYPLFLFLIYSRQVQSTTKSVSPAGTRSEVALDNTQDDIPNLNVQCEE